MNPPRKPPVGTDPGAYRRDRRDRLVNEFLHLVPPIARGILSKLPRVFELDDLIAAGNVGLLKAATDYNPDDHGGCPFYLWARQKIRGAIIDSIRRKNYEESTRPSIDRPVNCVDPEADADQLMSCVSAVAHRDSEEAAHREQLLMSLETAVAGLSRRKRALIQRYYRNRKKRGFSESHWRRRNAVREKHDEILTILRSRIAA